MIVFNDPIPASDHCARAVRLALGMRDRVERLAEKWRGDGHDLGFGIGIATGYATLGLIGFDKRREYTAIGRVTNLASRLCDEAKPGKIPSRSGPILRFSPRCRRPTSVTCNSRGSTGRWRLTRLSIGAAVMDLPALRRRKHEWGAC